MNELRSIPGFPNYSITRRGRVWSYLTSRWLKPRRCRNGRAVCLRESGKTLQRLIHRLVWTVWVGDIPSGEEIDHIDRNQANNCVWNLRLVSRTENNLNAGVRKDNSSGLKGVGQHKAKSKYGHASWYGRVRRKGVIHMTGYFHTPEEANEALKTLRERVCGAFAYHE